MTIPIQELYRMYLSSRDISLVVIRDWLALHQWDISEEDEDLADEADVALFHLADGYIDEEDLRLRLATVLERRTMASVSASFPIGTIKPTISAHSYGTASTAENHKQVVLIGA